MQEKQNNSSKHVNNRKELHFFGIPLLISKSQFYANCVYYVTTQFVYKISWALSQNCWTGYWIRRLDSQSSNMRYGRTEKHLFEVEMEALR